MSDSKAIVILTETLRDLIIEGTTLSDADFSTKPPHRARTESKTGNQINLFLYQTAVNAAWQGKNSSLPGQTTESHSERPLALNLYYLVTAYGKDDDARWSHQLLGEVMSVFNRYNVLPKDKIKRLEGSSLHEQEEPIRIIPHPLSLEDMSKLWSAFQASYHISVAYQVSVVILS